LAQEAPGGPSADEARRRRLERTAERELLPVAEAFGLSVCGWAPLGAGILTGKYTAGTSVLPDDSRRAAANQARLTERNLAIAGEVDRVADSLGAISAQEAAAWVRSRGVIPILGIASWNSNSSRTPSAS
jgi:aryl-alcohol dehydrogenase-like predicted oxidoreductase